MGGEFGGEWVHMYMYGWVPLLSTWIYKILLMGSVLSCSSTRVSDSLWSHGLYPARLLCPWDFPGKDTAVGCHSLLQGIFPIQESHPVSPAWQADSLPLSHLGSPKLKVLHLYFSTHYNSEIFCCLNECNLLVLYPEIEFSTYFLCFFTFEGNKE